MTRQPSAQITLRPTFAALADIRCQRTMPSACGGALPASSALRTEPASVPVSCRPPGYSPTTDLARFGSAGQRLSRAGKPVRDRQRRPRAHSKIAGTFPGSETSAGASPPGSGPGAQADQCHTRAREPGHSDFQDPRDSPHGLYRALILTPGERVTWPPKCGFIREYGHAVSLLIMASF
jgi:hypothetical protein